MGPSIESVGCRTVTRPWTFVDFIIVILGGFLGAAVFAVAGILADNEDALILLSLGGQYLGHLFVLWLVGRSKTDPSLGFEIRNRDTLYVFAGLGLQLALSLIFLPLVLILFPDGGSAQEVSSAIAGLGSTAAKVAAVAISVVLAPVTEELAFRGVLIRALGDRSRRSLILISAAVFSLFHLLGLASSNFVQSAVVVLPQLFIVGAVLAWITLRSGRLGPAIFLHSGFNLLAAIVLLLPQDLITP